MESAQVRIGLEFCKRKGENKYSKGLRAILTHSIRDLALDCSKYERDFANLISPGKVLDSLGLTQLGQECRQDELDKPVWPPE